MLFVSTFLMFEQPLKALLPIDTTSLRSIFSSMRQFSKALLPICDSGSDVFTSLSDVQFLNCSLSTIFVTDGRVISVRLSQSLNADAPMVFTDWGRSMVRRAPQPLKVPLPMAASWLGSFISARLMQLLKALSPMATTFSDSVTSVSAEQPDRQLRGTSVIEAGSSTLCSILQPESIPPESCCRALPMRFVLPSTMVISEMSKCVSRTSPGFFVFVRPAICWIIFRSALLMVPTTFRSVIVKRLSSGSRVASVPTESTVTVTSCATLDDK